MPLLNQTTSIILRKGNSERICISKRKIDCNIAYTHARYAQASNTSSAFEVSETSLGMWLVIT